MGKILVGLSVPAINWRSDLFVPTEVPIALLTKVLAKGVADLSDGRYSVSDRELLTLREPSLLLHPDKCLQDYGMQDGAQLILL